MRVVTSYSSGMVWVALLVACGPTAGDTATPPAVEGEPPPAPLFAATDAVAAMANGLQHGLPDPLDLFDTYLALMALGDTRCPGPGDQLIDTVVPPSGCTSESGARYAGVSVVMDEGDLNSGDPDYVARLVGGDFAITDVEGETFDFGGQVIWSAQAKDGEENILAQTAGTFAYAGGSPWLAAGVSTVLTMQVAARNEGASRLGLSGGLGTEGVDLWFDDLLFDADACPEGVPSGALEVRDPSGAWWTLAFANRCDGCGTLAYSGQPDTEACMDLTGFYADSAAMLRRRP